MTTRRAAFIFVAASLAAAAVSAPLLAAETKAFGTANFEAAKEKGPVIAHIDASWCPTCRAQKTVLAKLLADPKFSKVAVFAIDYDSEKPTLRALNAPDRSTILVFKDGKEVGRAVADTSEEKIAALLQKAL